MLEVLHRLAPGFLALGVGQVFLRVFLTALTGASAVRFGDDVHHLGKTILKILLTYHI